MRTLLCYLFAALLCGCQPMQLRGKVIDRNGKPVSSAVIVKQRSGQPVAEIRSDREGRFLLDSLHLDDKILVMAPGFQAETTVYDYPLSQHPNLTFWLKRKCED